MRRREFITLMSGAIAWPLVAHAQELGRSYRLGLIVASAPQSPAFTAMLDELRLNGFVEGQNLIIVPSSFGPADASLASHAAALIKDNPDVIVGGPELPIQAVRTLTRSIPIVGMTEDMVAEGFVQSLAHPGGNITGISLLSPELDGKRQDILIEIVPKARRIAAIADGKVTKPSHTQALQQGAKSRGVEVSVFSVNEPKEIASAIETAKASGCEAINFLASPLFSIPTSHTHEIVVNSLAAVRLPAIFQWPEAAETDSLAAYGPRITEMYRQRTRMAVKILRGARPSDIPVEQPERFEFVINLKTAKAIGVDVPAGLVARADKLIE
jgi:putative tryptophan/tyrosine transport system substrate-binding protein